MRVLAPVVWFALAFAPEAQVEIVKPEFTARQIGPTGGWLWPGRMFTIYGKNLGPIESCVREAGGFRPDGPNGPEELATVERILPTSLCGVQVLLDEEPAPLIYVHEKQINFVVPGSRTFGNKVVVRVVRGGISSIPAVAKFGPDRMWLYQDGPAFTGMPVWVRLYQLSESMIPVELPFGLPLLGLDCSRIELKFNGVVVQERQLKTPRRQITYSGPPCPTPPIPDRQSLAGRLPLHLRYRFDQPGTYFARYVPGSNRFGYPPNTEATEWVPIQVKAGSADQRRQWIAEKRRPAPTDTEALVYDFLPSIFGYGDADALRIGLTYLYNADVSVRRSTAAYLRDYYAAAELVPALRRIQQRRGKSKIIEQLLSDLGPVGGH